MERELGQLGRQVRGAIRSVRPRRAAPLVAALAIALSGCSILTGGTVSNAPTVSSISPNYGAETGGNQVLITGSNFSGTTAVNFGGTAATKFSVVSNSEIEATVPASSSANNVQVTVANSSASSTKVCVPIIPLPGCAAADYSYLKQVPWNLSMPVNISNMAVPIPGTNTQILVSATGGTVSVSGSMGYAVDANVVPSGFVASGTVTIANLTVTFKGQISQTIEIPLPLGLPYGLDAYVTITPALQVTIPVTLVLNASWSFAGGIINGALVPMASTLTCKGVNINSLPSAFGTCIDASATAPTLNGLLANLTVSPFWLQVGPPGLDAAIGPLVGLSAGLGNGTGIPYWEVCASLGYSVQASILSHSGNIVGPVQIDGSSQGDPQAYCPMGAAS